MDRVLVPLDGSELAERILIPARMLLRDARHPHVTLLRVVASRTLGEKEDERDRAEAYLNERAELLTRAGLEVTTSVAAGDAAEEILACTAKERPDLLAMATHGWSGVTRLVRGSVAERVLRHSPAPVLLCNPTSLDQTGKADTFPRILVPLDGSPLADCVLPLVERLARTFDADVTLLRVEHLDLYVPVAVPSPLLSPLLSPPVWKPELVEGSLRQQRERLAAAGVRVQVRATFGIESAEILRAAEQADLVAMSTHGRSGVSRWWFGSVAEQVLRHCDRPLLVVRAPATGPAR